MREYLYMIILFVIDNLNSILGVTSNPLISISTGQSLLTMLYDFATMNYRDSWNESIKVVGVLRSGNQIAELFGNDFKWDK